MSHYKALHKSTYTLLLYFTNAKCSQDFQKIPLRIHRNTRFQVVLWGRRLTLSPDPSPADPTRPNQALLLNPFLRSQNFSQNTAQNSAKKPFQSEIIFSGQRLALSHPSCGPNSPQICATD